MAEKYRKYTENTIFFLCLLLIAAISACTTLYSDDFVYGTYFCDGFDNFLNMTREHYFNVNGRAFVHFMLELVLVFKDRLFVVVLPLMILITAEMYYRITGGLSDKTRRIGFYAFYLAGVMFVPTCVLREGVLWMAGAMNYIFPTFMALSAFYVIKKTCDDEEVKCYYYPLLFLCGATTEQGGMMAVCFSVLYVMCMSVNKQKIIKRVYVLIALELVGYATVVFSPGTFSRMASETASASMSVYDGFKQLYLSVLQNAHLIWIFLSCGIVLSYIIGRKKPFAGGAGVVSFFTVYVLFLFEIYMAAGILMTIVFAAEGFYMIFSRHDTENGIMILTALASVGMLAFSTTYGYRNFLPAVLVMLCICSKQICGFFERMRKNTYLCCSVLIAVSAVSFFLPTLKGYAENRKIINDNLNNITNSGDGFYYNADLQSEYSYNQFFDYSFYYDGFKKIYGINKETKIYITGEEFEDLYYDDIHCENPVYVKNNIKYYPLRDIAEASGGKVEWNNETREAGIYFANNTVYYNENNKIFHTKNKWFDSRKYKLNDEDKYGRFFISHIYMTKENIEELFGIRLNIKGSSEDMQ